jgi:hypothetical protein
MKQGRAGEREKGELV